MPLDPEQRSSRARLAAYRRHHPDDADVPADAADIERQATDKAIDQIVARAPRMTPEQRARIGAIVKYPPLATTPGG